jgi:hypothetical protein
MFLKQIVLVAFVLGSTVAQAIPAPTNEVIAALTSQADFQQLLTSVQYDQLTVKRVSQGPVVNAACRTQVWSKSGTILEVTLVSSWDRQTTTRYFFTMEAPSELQMCR